ncbi:MAG: hypothetical protein ACREUX_22800 [Burkholderiales bacterium]
MRETTECIRCDQPIAPLLLRETDRRIENLFGLCLRAIPVQHENSFVSSHVGDRPKR